MTPVAVPRAAVHGAPEVAVVYVTFGAFDWLRRSLEALVATTPPCYEVVVVDNATPGADAQLRDVVAGATILCNDRNLGFGVACNQGADATLAPAIVFLNPDALPEDGWLPPLLAALQEPDVGAASPAVLELNGSVQAAGSLVARDGRTAAYGEGLAPDDPVVAFPREVDYPNGACTAVRRAAFLDAGGFDADYAPAYFEDADLGFALRRRGLRTVHVPGSAVRHARGTSSGEAAHALAQRNLLRFRARWREDLATRPQWHGLPNAAVTAAARDALASSRVLVLFDDDPGAAARRAALLEQLAAYARTSRITCVHPPGTLPHAFAAAVQAQGIEMLTLDADAAPSWLRERPRHHDVVVLPAAPDAALRSAVAATQPAAATLSEPELGDGTDTRRVLAAVGVAPRPVS